MRRLEEPVSDLDELYAGLILPDGGTRGGEGSHPRPWVALGMVSSVDGRATIDGGTADLGGVADQVAFRRLRAACDAILVGAGTARVESYGPTGGSAARQADREARGLAASPRLVVVTGSLDLDVDQPMFGDPRHRPLLVTHGAAPAGREAALAEVADVVRCGEREVDLPAALERLGELGHRRILCEGGPGLNAALLAEDLVDELFLTVAPVLVGGPAPRIVGSGQEAVHRLELADLHEHEGELVLRYRRVR